MAFAIASMSVGFSACGDDEPEVVLPGQGNTPGNATDENANISVVSQQISGNGTVFAPGETLELTVKNLVINYDGAPGTFKQITFVVDDTPVTTLYDLPASLRYDKISTLTKGEHTVKGIILAKSGSKTGEAVVDLLKFYVVAETPQVNLNPTLLYLEAIEGVGPDNQKYFDKKEEEYTLSSQPLSINVTPVNTSGFTVTGNFVIGSTLINPTANCEYQIKDMKTYVLKDWNSDQTISLPQLTESSGISFTLTNEKKIGFNKLSFIYSYTLETSIDGMTLPSMPTIDIYEVNVQEK